MSTTKAKKTATKKPVKKPNDVAAVEPGGSAPRWTKPCDCIAKADGLLKERGHKLSLAFSYAGGEERVVIETVKLQSAPERTKRITMVATFCPFCGVACP